MKHSAFRYLIAPSLAALAAGTAHAQDGSGNGTEGADDPSSGVGEIVVSAQKQLQDIQDVPIAISVVSGDSIQNAQVVDVLDLANTLPNVQINSFSNSPDSAVFTIRGIGVNDADPYVGTTVSVVVDGTVVGVNTAALLSLFDVERVEVLRGPQGTLFGANTTGGVINVVTKRPTGEWGGEAQFVYGNYNQIVANAAINIPLGENLAGKISVLHNSNNGFFRNFVNNRRLGARDITTMRGYLQYDDGGDYDAALIAEYTATRNDSQTGVLIAQPGELFFRPGETTAPFSFRRGQSLDQPNSNDRDTYAISLEQNLVTGIGTLTSITSYREYDNLLFSDDDAVSAVLLQTRRAIKHRQFSQELRNLVDLSDATRLIVGAFYFGQSYFLDQDGKLDGFLPGLGQPQTQDQENWSASVFGQIYHDLTPDLTIQAGIRYSYERTTAVSTSANSINPTGPSRFDDPIIAGTLVVASGREGWNNLGWKLGLDYQATADVMLYGYYARGFKSGGFTGRIVIAEDIGPFNPETLDTFEVGMKADLLDRRLRLNVAAFLNKYDDMQVVQNLTFPSGANSATITNAGKAESKGIEIEATAVPVTGLTITGSLAYLDAEFVEYNTRALNAAGVLVPVSFAGNRLMNAPRWSASSGVNWEGRVGPGELNIGAQYSYTSSKFTSVTNLPSELVPSIDLANAHINWKPDDFGVTIGFWVRNLFDERFFNQKLALPGIGTLASIGPPRTYGIDLRVEF